MSTVLITGASGFIGSALAASMSDNHDVICMSRKNPELGLPWIQGDFASADDLQKLNDRKIDILIHLAAVTGGASEHDGITVNVEGSRCLMRYMIDHGCKKFVMTSSIAAVGFQSPAFRPLQIPIPDEHPCLDRDGYGFSKYMMEEVTKYYQRQNEKIDVINLRLAVVCDDNAMPSLKQVGPIGQWALGGITVLPLREAVRVFTMAAEAPYKPGVRIMNAAGKKAWTAVPVRKILENWWGDDVDLSFYNKSENEYASVFDVSRIEKELGFISEINS